MSSSRFTEANITIPSASSFSRLNRSLVYRRKRMPCACIDSKQRNKPNPSPKKTFAIKPDETLQKNSSANIALPMVLARVRKRTRFAGNIARWIWTKACLDNCGCVSNVALITKTHILLFFASNFRRISKEPNGEPLAKTEPWSLDVDLDSYSKRSMWIPPR